MNAGDGKSESESESESEEEVVRTHFVIHFIIYLFTTIRQPLQ